MRKESKSALSGFYAPIDLPTVFPITQPKFSTPPDTPHVHNCFEIGLCRSGAGVFIVMEKIFSCVAGDAIFINHKEFHILKNASPLNSDWKFINLDPAGLLAGWVSPDEAVLNVSRLCGRNFSNLVHSKNHPDITSLVHELITEMEKGGNGFKSAVRALLWALLVKLHRLIPVERVDEEANDPEDIIRLYPALTDISSHYSTPLAIHELAMLCKCSLSTFRRIFFRCFGCSPLEYLNEFRLKVAITLLLSTDRSILEIALDSGFPTLSNFNRLFKTRFKKSPREVRRQKVADA